MAGEKIQVLASDVAVKLRRGDNPEACALRCRRVRRSEVSDLMKIAHVPGNEMATAVSLAELAARVRIVGAEGLTDAATGEAVAFAAVRVPGLSRPIASRDVYDALGDADLEAIVAAVPDALSGRPAMSEDARGNS